MSKAADSVREFHEAFGLPVSAVVAIPDTDRIDLRRCLIEEEAKEACNELDLMTPNSHPAYVRLLAKELADVLYVTYGCALEFGIDLDAVFDEVHRSNMSKLDDDGKPVYREDGKVIKGPNYEPPNLEALVA